MQFIKKFPKFTKNCVYNFCKLDVVKFCPLQNIRNIAIIAHVDHGKTTLVDALLQQSGIETSNVCQMDSNDLEQEKGITILSKITSIVYKQQYKINIVDTPGHHDFGGEVERIMDIVDGVLLLVCASEGVKTQTKFVLKKALQQNAKLIVVINKVDRDTSRIQEVENEIFELMCEMEVPEEFLDYKLYYASGRSGWAVENQEDINKEDKNILCLFDGIVENIQPPKVVEKEEFSMVITQTASNLYYDKLVIGKVMSGKAMIGDNFFSVDQKNKVIQQSVVSKIIKRYGLEDIELNEAHKGDLVSLGGFAQSKVSQTISSDKSVIPCVEIDPPIMSLQLNVNSSPLAGNEGSKMTKSQIIKRLQEEAHNDVALEVDTSQPWIKISGRGDLHLGLILEKLRREGFELSVQAPEIASKMVGDEKHEPVESVEIQCNPKHSPMIIQRLMQRGAIYHDSVEVNPELFKLKFDCTTRGLIGFRSEIQNETSGTAYLQSEFLEYAPVSQNKVKKAQKGAIISSTDGTANSFAIQGLEKFGQMFVGNGQTVYNGMVIGEAIKDMDVEVNPTKKKELNNIRSTVSEDKVNCKEARQFGVEDAITYIRNDEYVEITPKNVRIRKIYLDPTDRARERRRIKSIK